MTLRYHATGENTESLMFQFSLQKTPDNSIRVLYQFVEPVCKATYNGLTPNAYENVNSEEKWNNLIESNKLK